MAPMLSATLMPYQEEALDWCLDRESKGCILAYDMGLGKTVIACALMAANPVKTVVMVPASLLDQWVAEIQRHTEGFRVAVYHGTQRHSQASQEMMRRADIVVSTVAVIARDLYNGLDIPAGRWIVDEAHRLKNKLGVSYTRLYEEVGGVENTVFLTGTPVCNRCDDLISLICLTNHQPYNSPHSWKRMDETAKIKRLQEILPSVLLRRTKEDTIPEMLPKFQTKNIPVTMPYPSEQREFYQSFLNDDKLLRRITRMRQSANNHAQLTELFQKQQQLTEPLDASETAVKVTALQTLLKAIPANEKVLVFSQFTSLLNHLSGLFPGNYFYHGGLTPDEKASVISAFKQAEPSTPASTTSAAPAPTVLFINLRAGGCGLNLTEANHVILMEPYWNESEQKQAIDRVYRIGQTRPVTIYRLYMRCSIESWIHSLQKTKQKLVNYLIQPSDTQTPEDIQSSRNGTMHLFHTLVMAASSSKPMENTYIQTHFGEYIQMTDFLESKGVF